MSPEPEVTLEAARSAKAQVLESLAASELFESVRSIGIGWDRHGSLCVRVIASPEAVEALRDLVSESVAGVSVEFFEGSKIRGELTGSPRSGTRLG